MNSTPFRTSECRLHDGVPVGRVMRRCQHFGDRFIAWSEQHDGSDTWLDFGDFEGNVSIRNSLKVEYYEPPTREEAERIWQSMTVRLMRGDVPVDGPGHAVTD